jgi:hypothetical protein
MVVRGGSEHGDDIEGAGATPLNSNQWCKLEIVVQVMGHGDAL